MMRLFRFGGPPFANGVNWFLYRGPFRFGVYLLWRGRKAYFRAHYFCRTCPAHSGLGLQVGRFHEVYGYPMDKILFYLKAKFPSLRNPDIHGEVRIPFIGRRALNMGDA